MMKFGGLKINPSRNLFPTEISSEPYTQYINPQEQHLIIQFKKNKKQNKAKHNTVISTFNPAIMAKRGWASFPS